MDINGKKISKQKHPNSPPCQSKGGGGQKMKEAMNMRWGQQGIELGHVADELSDTAADPLQSNVTMYTLPQKIWII